MGVGSILYEYVGDNPTIRSDPMGWQNPGQGFYPGPLPGQTCDPQPIRCVQKAVGQDHQVAESHVSSLPPVYHTSDTEPFWSRLRHSTRNTGMLDPDTPFCETDWTAVQQIAGGLLSRG